MKNDQRCTKRYTTHDIHSRASVDGVIAGADMTEGPSQIELSYRAPLITYRVMLTRGEGNQRNTRMGRPTGQAPHKSRGGKAQTGQPQQE